MKISLFWQEQIHQWPCGLVTIFASGILVYFGLPFEPSHIILIGLLLGVGMFAVWIRHHPVKILFLVLSFFLLGLCAATLRTSLIQAPQLERSLFNAEIKGRITEIEYLPKGYRLTLDRLKIDRLDPEKKPNKVRIKLWKLQPELKPGDYIGIKASLSPISRPALFDGFDFRRDAFFRGLGGLGFAYQEPVLLKAAPDNFFLSYFDRLSHRIAQRILEIAPGRGGAFMIALITGEQATLPNKDVQSMRDSGLAHILSISGLHIGMAFGLLFFLLRAILALIPDLALNYPIKKWALIPAFAGAFFYAMIAGMPVPTERALIMTGIIGLAILFDRQALSLRTVAFAAFVVLLFNPEALIGPSFQLSFSAVTSLIALYEWMKKYQWGSFENTHPLLRRILRSAFGIMVSSIAVTLATAPFAIYHFNRIPVYGAIANMIGIPLTGFLVMPAGIVSLLLMPFGWDAYPLQIMEWASLLILDLGRWVQSWPSSVITLPSMPVAGLLIAALGLVMVFFIVGPMRLIGMFLYFVGMASSLWVSVPDVIIAENGRLFAFKDDKGQILLSSLRREKLTGENWLKRYGQSEFYSLEQATNVQCDANGCVFKKDGQIIAIGYDEDAIKDDCSRADLVINLEPIRIPCQKQKIDRFTLWREGSQAIFVEGDRMEIIPVAEENTRPWQARRYKPRTKKNKEDPITSNLGEGDQEFISDPSELGSDP